MKKTLLQKLCQYLWDNNPDKLIGLQETGQLTTWLQEKITGIKPLLATLNSQRQPAYIIEESCMQELTRELRPSRFLYVSAALESEFEPLFRQLQSSGLLIYELLNMLSHCHPAFDRFRFSEDNEDNRFLYYAITGTIREYLDQREKESVSHGIQHRQAVRS